MVSGVSPAAGLKKTAGLREKETEVSYEGLTKKWTSNIERPTSNDEWKKWKKETYDMEKLLLEYSVRIIKNDILEEAEKLI